MDVLYASADQKIAGSSGSNRFSGHEMHFVQLEETRRVVVVEILEHNSIHGEQSEYFIQVDVIVRSFE